MSGVSLGNGVSGSLSAGVGGGGVSAFVASAASGAAPSNTVAPVISGLRLSGATLSTTNGTWDNVPTSYTYQWKNAGVDIGGATASTYTVQLTDEGDSITCVVTATNDAGSASQASNALTIISGLKLWLDASLPSSIAEVAGSVSQWNDISGNGYHATQGTGSRQPSTGAATLGGLNVISFDGTSDYLELANGVLDSTANTFVSVFRTPSSFTGANGVIIGALFTNRFFVGFDTAGNLFTRFGNSGNFSSGIALSTNTAYIVMATALSAGTAQVNLSTGASSSTSGQTIGTTYTNLAIGAYSATPDSFYKGDIGSSMCFQANLSTADKNSIGSFLSSKWGVSWTNI